MTRDTTGLIGSFRRAGQGQGFAFFDRLPAESQARLLSEAAEIDLGEVDRLVRTLVAEGASRTVDLEGLSPAPSERLPSHGGEPAAWSRAKAAGETALRSGRVAAFTVAGGQGTRLGYDGPKGTFPVTPVLRRSLFQVFAWKILAAGGGFWGALPWVLMDTHHKHAQNEGVF